MKLYYLIYVSYATGDWTSARLTDLRKHAIANNEINEITGALLYLKSKFIQVLEGEEGTIKALLEKIKKNPGHKDLLVVIDGPLEERKFPKWHMGFKAISDKEIEDSTELMKLVESINTSKSQTSHPATVLLNKFFTKNS